MTQSTDSVEGGKLTNATETTKRSCDILLNNFQIKKKRYRVLLNHDHIVWERWDPKRKSKETNEKVNTNKETELERQQLSNNPQYGSNSNIVHINEIIRVRKGDTKSATLRVDPDPHSRPNENDLSGSGQALQYTQSNVASKTTPTAQYVTIHYAERVVKSPTDCNRWQIRSLTLYNADPYIIAQWHTLLNLKLYENPIRLHIRRLLVFINPYGGRKEGLQTYERHCKPIFQLAGIDASCVISQRANQIRDIIMTHDLKPYDAVCCVGGDGTAAEVINGLIFRTMRDRGLDMRQPAYIPKPALPIGIIPAGSTDTIAYSVHGTADAATAAIHVILGQRRGCDICSVRNRQGIVRFCASVFSYGYLGDVAAHSEKYRWMGPKRYEYTGVKAFLANRGYEAEIRLLDTADDISEAEVPTNRANMETESVCYANCQRCSSVISNHNGEDDSIDYADLAQDNLQHNATYVNSNWTIYTEQSPEPDFNGIENVSDSGARDTSDFVDKTTYKTPDITPVPMETPGSKNDNDCDRNLRADDLEIKAVVKCDKTNNDETEIESETQMAGETATINSRNSFSFCSTNPTINTHVNRNSNNNSNNELAITSPPITPLPGSIGRKKWKVIRGHFFMISCANITCACSRTPNGISRYNHLGDGQLDVILVRKTTIFNNIRFALNTMGRDGEIRNLPFVEVYRTRQFQFRAHFDSGQSDETMRASTQPIAEAFSDDVADKLVSSWNCDGEVVHDLDVTMTSHCQLIDVFMRGPYSYTKSVTDVGSDTKLCCCIPNK